jgi:ABC-type sugar transport system substrate-binding protein
LGFISWAALLHVACKELEDQSTQTPDRGDIGFIGASEDDPLWGVLRNTAERYPEAMAGFELRVEAPRKRSVLAQIEILRSMHTPDLRGVCIQPAVDKDTEADMLRDELVKMRASGVAVVTMLTRLDTASPFLHAGLDEMAVGAAMADAVLEAVDGDGTIAILHDRSTTDGHFDRYLGARQRCARLPALTVL